MIVAGITIRIIAARMSIFWRAPPHWRAAISRTILFCGHIFIAKSLVVLFERDLRSISIFYMRMLLIVACVLIFNVLILKFVFAWLLIMITSPVDAWVIAVLISAWFEVMVTSWALRASQEYLPSQERLKYKASQKHHRMTIHEYLNGCVTYTSHMISAN